MSNHQILLLIFALLLTTTHSRKIPAHFRTDLCNPCTTTTAYITTLTKTFSHALTTCTSTSTLTKLPTTTIYTTALPFSQQPSTITLNSYGDLYHPGDLASTPTCPPPNCYGTTTTTLNETLTTSTTAGTEGPFTTYSSACTETTYSGTTVSTTQQAKCAPVHLVSEVGGHGVYQPTAGSGMRVEYPETRAVDGSDCCQMCVDDERCIASYSLTRAGVVGVCGLVVPINNTSSSTCDAEGALEYSDSARFEYGFVDPDEGGYRVQSGCGRIQPVVYIDNCV